MEGYTALHIAAFRGSASAPRWVWHIYAMLCQKARMASALDLVNANGRTALHMASAHGNLWLAECLLQAGAGALI